MPRRTGLSGGGVEAGAAGPAGGSPGCRGAQGEATWWLQVWPPLHRGAGRLPGWEGTAAAQARRRGQEASPAAPAMGSRARPTRGPSTWASRTSRPRTDEELSFRAGDLLRVEGGGLWGAVLLDAAGGALGQGYVPHSYLAEKETVESELWCPRGPAGSPQGAPLPQPSGQCALPRGWVLGRVEVRGCSWGTRDSTSCVPCWAGRPCLVPGGLSTFGHVTSGDRGLQGHAAPPLGSPTVTSWWQDPERTQGVHHGLPDGQLRAGVCVGVRGRD